MTRYSSAYHYQQRRISRIWNPARIRYDERCQRARGKTDSERGRERERVDGNWNSFSTCLRVANGCNDDELCARREQNEGKQALSRAEQLPSRLSDESSRHNTSTGTPHRSSCYNTPSSLPVSPFPLVPSYIILPPTYSIIHTSLSL